MHTLVFVYGTLKRGGENHHFLAGQRFLGEAHTGAGYRLYHLSGYPGMVPLAEDREGVTGEVWSVDAACLAELDRLEGTAEGLYRRAAITLLPPFGDQPVQTYIYARSVAGKKDMGSTWVI